ncbi:hypothetical protein [Deinococcus maricopensis]|uniref:hypothetical protein n=1 Tax=Deinococcus maricopensis TaxID=309887 RepID=UPI001FE10EA5|nr:hypothetical protein [Deinococcus maricopensis]
MLVIFLGLALAYFTAGVRLGFVTLMPTYMLNAKGTAEYTYRAYNTDDQVGVSGECRNVEGKATLRLYAPDGRQIDGRTCPEGTWTLQLLSNGQQGYYRLYIEYDHFTGVLNLKEKRQ